MNPPNKLITCCNLILIITGSFLIFSAIGTYLFSQTIVQQKIHENVIIKPGSNAYKFWLNPPASIYRKYYLFDVKNPIEVENGEKPVLVQLGPYVYSEVWEKRHVEFLGVEFLRFTPVVTLHFEPSLSNGNESDRITFLNIPAVGMIESATNSNSQVLGPALVNTLLGFLDTKLFVTRTVGELISGYTDPLMFLAKTFVPKLVKDDKFSLLNGKNGTEWQNYSMMTGFDYASNVARLVSWNGLEKLKVWDGDKANLINGTDGTFYPPFLNKKDKIYSFNPDMCRSYTLTFLKENEIEGIKTYDFHLPKNIFYNASLNPDNEGFCTNDCLGNGVLNISSCYGGVSGFISQPHFLNAEQKFLNAVSGLRPNQDIHDFVLHFEPTTAVPISGNIRLQINFHILRNEKINLVKNVKPVLLPVVWFDEDIALDADTRGQLSQVSFYIGLVTIIPIVMISIGALLIFLSSFLALRRYFNLKALRKGENSNGTASLINSEVQ